MTKISQYALALCLALSAQSPYSHAFTFTPRQSITTKSTTSPSFLTTSSPFIIHDALFQQPQTNTCLNMASTMSRLEDSSVEVTIAVPAQATQAAYDKAITELSKKIDIKGFRKGAKIPAGVLENSLASHGNRNAIRVQAINDLANSLIETAIRDDHGLEPLGQPTLKVDANELAEAFVPGQDLEMVVKCDVWPEVKFKEVEGDGKPYHGLKGKYKRKPYDQKKFDVAMNDLRERHAVLTPLDDPSHKLAMGDACVVNMQGYMAEADGVTKGEPLPDAASGDDVEVILGEGRYMEGLVEGLVGATVGETVPITVSFPERLKDKTLAGKKAIFDVKVESVSNRVLPEMDDEFANKVRPGLTIETLQSELRKAVDEEDAKAFVKERNEALSKALAEVMDTEVPDTIVTSQAREKYANMMADFRDQGMADADIKKQITTENFLKFKDIYKPDICRDFKVTLAVEELAKLENIEIPSYQIDEQMENLKMEAKQAGEEFDENAVKARVQQTLMTRLVFDYLAENADLDVEFIDEDQEKIDQQMLEKLAQESLNREGFEGSFSDVQDAEVVDETQEA